MRVKRNPCDVIVLKTTLIPKKRSDILGWSLFVYNLVLVYFHPFFVIYGPSKGPDPLLAVLRAPPDVVSTFLIRYFFPRHFRNIRRGLALAVNVL